MWQADEAEASDFLGCVEPKEVMIYHTLNSFLVDAELCRDPSCGVDHVYPIDVVFSVHKKGPLQIWSSCFAPGVPGVHYRDRKDVAEDEITVQKRHLSELDRPHPVDAMFGHTREHCWSAMQKLMSEKYGTYLKPEDLDLKRTWNIVMELRGTRADATLEKKAEIYFRAFRHLMFDRTYFEASKANGFEGDTDVNPLQQWVADFETLVAYAREQERISNSLKKSKSKKHAKRRGAFIHTTPSLPRDASTTACDSNASKPPHPLRQANQELYATNKKLANENASSEAKLHRTKANLSALTSKVETKLATPHRPGDLVHNLSTVVVALLHHSAKENTMQEEAIHPEVALLTEQLKKLAGLRKQLAGARQKKKTA